MSARIRCALGSVVSGSRARSGRRVAIASTRTGRSLPSAMRCSTGCRSPPPSHVRVRGWARTRTRSWARSTHSTARAPTTRWSNSWLRRAQRLVTPGMQSTATIVLGDATRDELDPDAAYVRALELLAMRAGARVMGLSVRGIANMSEALATQRPDGVIIAGGAMSDDAVARWAYAVRLASGPLPVAIYRRGPQRTRVRTTGATMLPGTPGEAARQMIDLVSHPVTGITTGTSPARFAADG